MPQYPLMFCFTSAKGSSSQKHFVQQMVIKNEMVVTKNNPFTAVSVIAVLFNELNSAVGSGSTACSHQNV